MNLTALNRRSENVVIKAVVVAKLKFSDIEREILGADLVERANDTALENAPEAYNRLSVDCADNVLALGMVNRGVREFLAEMAIANPLIGAEQANLFRDGFIDESLQGRALHVVDNTRDDIAFALDRASNNSLTGSGRARLAVALIPMPVLGFATDKSFVNFNDAAKFGLGLNESRADFVAHGMRRAVAAEAHDALNLKGANSLLAGQHQVHDAEPFAKRLVRVLKNGARDMREAITVHLASFALPVTARCQRVDLGIAATRAMNAIRPAPRDQIGTTGFLINKCRFELRDCHLMDCFGALDGGHGVSSLVGGYSHGG